MARFGRFSAMQPKDGALSEARLYPFMSGAYLISCWYELLLKYIVFFGCVIVKNIDLCKKHASRGWIFLLLKKSSRMKIIHGHVKKKHDLNKINY